MLQFACKTSRVFAVKPGRQSMRLNGDVYLMRRFFFYVVTREEGKKREKKWGWIMLVHFSKTNAVGQIWQLFQLCQGEEMLTILLSLQGKTLENVGVVLHISIIKTIFFWDTLWCVLEVFLYILIGSIGRSSTVTIILYSLLFFTEAP